MTEIEYADAVRANSQRLFLIALSFVKNKSDAEDIIQSVFLKLWLNSKPFSDDVHRNKWLTLVTVNESKNLIRSPFKKKVVSIDDFYNVSAFDNTQDFDLYKAVASLPQKYSSVIHLFYYEDMSVKDIAELLKISESSVKTRLSRARNELKSILGEGWNDE